MKQWKFVFFVIILVTSIIPFFSVNAVPTMYENSQTFPGGSSAVYATGWKAQTFTVGATAHTVTSVVLRMARVGSPGILTVSIRDTDVNGHPTGSDLTSGTIDANGFTTAGDWYEIVLTEYALSANTKYAIVCRALSAVYPTSYVNWRQDSTNPYAGGNRENSVDSGGTWTSTGGTDFTFEVFGNPSSISVTRYINQNIGTSLGVSRQVDFSRSITQGIHTSFSASGLLEAIRQINLSIHTAFGKSVV